MTNGRIHDIFNHNGLYHCTISLILQQGNTHLQSTEPMNSISDKGPYRASLPLYTQIAESLLERIESGELAPDQRLPSERDLSQMLNVSRMTLRAALRELDSKGLLVRRPGDGTYIAKPKIERHADRLVPFTTSMQQRGYKPSAKVIVFEQRLAEVSTARQLQVPVSTSIFYCQRVRLINQEPVLLENLYIPVSLFPGFGDFDLENRSIYEIMDTEYGIQVHHSQQSLESVSASDYEAELLEIQPGAPLMLERRLGFDEKNQPFEYGHDLYRGDRFRFFTEIAPLDLFER